MTDSSSAPLPPGSAVSTPISVPAPAPAFLTARQLAAALGVSRRTLTTWNQRRVIPSVRVGRVRRYELEMVREALRARSFASDEAPGIGGPSGDAAGG
ncbi:MAG: hypothetical protein JWR15_2027 [Prosthecobacter sp.]|nr:hypothetical protein [Prosthecobacter sp.]